jgi:hypothetical protein
MKAKRGDLALVVGIKSLVVRRLDGRAALDVIQRLSEVLVVVRDRLPLDAAVMPPQVARSFSFVGNLIQWSFCDW